MCSNDVVKAQEEAKEISSKYPEFYKHYQDLLAEASAANFYQSELLIAFERLEKLTKELEGLRGGQR